MLTSNALNINYPTLFFHFLGHFIGEKIQRQVLSYIIWSMLLHLYHPIKYYRWTLPDLSSSVKTWIGNFSKFLHIFTVFRLANTQLRNIWNTGLYTLGSGHTKKQVYTCLVINYNTYKVCQEFSKSFMNQSF